MKEDPMDTTNAASTDLEKNLEEVVGGDDEPAILDVDVEEKIVVLEEFGDSGRAQEKEREELLEQPPEIDFLPRKNQEVGSQFPSPPAKPPRNSDLVDEFREEEFGYGTLRNYRDNGVTSCGLRELVKPNVSAFTKSVRHAFDWLDHDHKGNHQGHAGFEELRKHVKQGSELCKEIGTILQERSELEATYAKGLSKLASKTARASRESLGTVAHSIQTAAAELEGEGELHKNLALALIEDIVKPLKVFIELQHKNRKAIENTVDKMAKNVNDLRNSEAKAKKNCYVCAKENERTQEQLLDAKVGRGKILSDKDISKLEAKKRKAEEAVKKSDYEYYAICVTAERTRLEWETAVLKGCGHFQTLEEDRLAYTQDLFHKYNIHLSAMGPKLMQSCERLNEIIKNINIHGDIQLTISQKGAANCVSEQILPDFYAEDMSNIMNKERRREALQKFLLLLKHDVERERRGKQGVENLARVFHETPTFGDQDAQNDVHEKLQHMRAILAYLEASRFKLQCCLSDLEGHPKPVHPLSKHLEYHKDKQGQLQTILKVPTWVRVDYHNNDQGWEQIDSMLDRGSADGTSHSPDNYDEFSLDSQESGASGSYSSGSQHTTQEKKQLPVCTVIYDYQANMYDELTIRPGDKITIYNKAESGWWQGELNGVVGIFPATYVEEIK